MKSIDKISKYSKQKTIEFSHHNGVNTQNETGAPVDTFK